MGPTKAVKRWQVEKYTAEGERQDGRRSERHAAIHKTRVYISSKKEFEASASSVLVRSLPHVLVKAATS